MIQFSIKEDFILKVRLQKYIADCGITSRRKAEELIVQGKIQINGETTCTLGTKVDPCRDEIRYKGEIIKPEKHQIYLMLYKPEKYMTTVKDQFQRPTVLDLLSEVKERVYPIGRLDYHTSGLLLLTNDGDIAYRIMHPKYEIVKTYIATVKGIPTRDQLEHMRKGIAIEEYITAPASVKMLRKTKNQSVLEIQIHEGRNRQVRKMCQAIGHPVIRLERTKVGKLTLGTLKKGEYRHLTSNEVEYLKKL